MRHFRLDRVRKATVERKGFKPRPEVDPAADVDGWPRTGEVEASRIARVWMSPERARWAREELRVAEELADGAVIVELAYKGESWLVRARAPGGRRRRRARARGRARGRARRRSGFAHRGAGLAPSAEVVPRRPPWYEQLTRESN